MLIQYNVTKKDKMTETNSTLKQRNSQRFTGKALVLMDHSSNTSIHVQLTTSNVIIVTAEDVLANVNVKK